jgi:hypothetical protein
LEVDDIDGARAIKKRHHDIKTRDPINVSDIQGT